MLGITSFLHDGNAGDVIASIPAMNEYARITGSKIILYLTNGQRAVYYSGATHPTLNSNGEMCMLNEKMIFMLSPLLKAQDFISDVKIHNGEKIDVDLNAIRKTNVGMPNFCISRWYFYVYPDLACDTSKQWLFVSDTDKDFAKNKIIVSRTERYLNPNINYCFLKKYESDILFIGTKLECVIFKERYGLDIEHLQISNFLELAQAIDQSKFHISNQTMAFQISQGLKHKRILELCEFAPNVIVDGENGYDFLAQGALEFYVNKLMG